MAADAAHSRFQSSQRSMRFVTRWKSLGSTPLEIKRGAQLSMAICTRSSMAMWLSFIFSAGGDELSRSFELCLSTGQRSPKIEVTDLWIAQNFVVCSFQAHLSALHHDPTC